MIGNKTLTLVEPELGGGQITRETIDQIATSSCSRLKISGLTQETFEYLIDQYGPQLKIIEFWKCPKVSDLSRLSTLDGIESLSFYWNQKAERLWDMTSNRRLRRLSFEDFSRLRSLEDIVRCESLETLRFGDAVRAKMEVESLGPVARIPSLRHLDFSVKKVVDSRIAPLARIGNLKSIEFPPRLFSTEKIAWLRARIEARVKSKVLRAAHKYSQPVAIRNGKKLDTLVIGKRKPFLDSSKDRKRIREYKKRFDEQVAAYRAAPTTPEPD